MLPFGELRSLVRSTIPLGGAYHVPDMSGRELFTCKVGLLTTEIERKQLERSSTYCDDNVTVPYTNDLSSSSHSVAHNWEKEAHRTRVRTTPAARKKRAAY